ncbi:MAG: DUF2304 domain-containing protein [Oligoflexales bacterium]|nr:DUF2304 domain-containing protein [Oligoflexales bacterium]
MALNILGIFISIITLLIVMELIRRRKLKEKYAIIWIGLFLAFLLICVRFEVVSLVGEIVGIKTPSNVLFFFGLMFCFIIVLSLSVIVSVLSDRVRTLAQQLALLEYEVRNKRE